MWIVDLVSRFLHILAAAWAVGALAYTRYVLSPGVQAMDLDQRNALLGRFSERLKPLALATIVLALLSGFYNFFRILDGGVLQGYHMMFGIKFLLALHVLSMLYVLSKPPTGDPQSDAKRSRQAFGALMTALIILAIGAYLRTLHA